jgi:hypothetical protein
MVAKDVADSAAGASSSVSGPAENLAGQVITESELQWTRLVRKLFGIRRLQRLWGHIGKHLQEFGSVVRKKCRSTSRR